MANLEEVLRDTMLWAASQNKTYRKLPFPVHEAQPATDVGIDFDFYGKKIAHPDQELLIQENPIWSYRSPVFSTRSGAKVVRVEAVKCCVRDMGFMLMPVLEEIEWGPVKIFSELAGREIELPLDEEFLVRCRYVPSGHIQESNSGFWQLPAKVDQSWEMIFGYELPHRASGDPAPLTEESLKDPFLMEEWELHVSPAQPEHGHHNTIVVRYPWRVLVCVSLVCCKERNNFDPGNLFGGGRIYPLIMVMSTQYLNRISASVRLTRPARTAHTKMGNELMSPDISGILFTDRNFKPLKIGPIAIPPRPFWDILFDYFLLDTYPGEYQVVRPAAKDHVRTLADSTKVPASLIHWSTRDVTKLAGQAEFDNIHFAPKMVVPADIIAANPKLTGMEKVTMAPFCVHDCLHMHWRWGEGDTEKHNLGWADEQTPYSAPGAPLVPSNQRVTLKMISPVSCLYTAQAESAEPKQWQIFMHHGLAYALAAGGMADFLMSSLSTMSQHIEQARPNWALFYWYLRNTFYGSDQVPRLTWDDGKLDELRKL